MNDFTDDEIEQFEQELEDTDLKALLVDQTATLRGIHQQLVLLNRALAPDETEETQMYACDHCNEQFEDVESHLRDEHKAPSGLSVKDVDFIEPV